jgi:hypothetical protein
LRTAHSFLNSRSSKLNSGAGLGTSFYRNSWIACSLVGYNQTGKVFDMRKAALVLATAATLAATAVVAPAPAEARGGFGPGLVGELFAGALIGGLASSAYAYGPGYGYYGGYAPAYYDYDYDDYAPAYYGGYAPAYYGGVAPAYYGYGYRRAYRPAYAYYGGPRYYHYRGWHHRWHRHW